jgi:hypothetical protein
VRGTHQHSLVEQETAGRPIESTPGVRTDIQERTDFGTSSQQDQRFGIAFDRCDDFMRAGVGYFIERAQTFGFR